MKRLSAAITTLPLVILSQAPSAALAGKPLHPNLSDEARVAIEAIDADQRCELPEAVMAEIEGLLLRPYDALTIQTEAERLIHVYARCGSPPRTTTFLAERVKRTDASCRVFFLLAVTKHPIAIQTLVDRLGDGDTYATAESPGHSEDLSIGSAASHILGELFPEREADASTSWEDWWGQHRDAYWRKWGERPSN